MPINPNAAIEISAFRWVPEFAQGVVRDLRPRWALEEAGQPYDVLYLSQGEQKEPPHRDRQPHARGVGGRKSRRQRQHAAASAPGQQRYHGAGEADQPLAGGVGRPERDGHRHAWQR